MPHLLAARGFDQSAVIFMVAAIASISLIFGAALWYERRRLQQLQAVADSLGLRFERDGGDALQGEYAAFPLFRRGRFQHAKALMSGTWNNVPVRVFDFRYIIGGGK